jgi:hypothetical protein
MASVLESSDRIKACTIGVASDADPKASPPDVVPTDCKD